MVVKRVLWLLLLIGLAGQVDVGTFASFTAITGNGASFATGSLVLTNKKNNATACASSSAAVTDVNDSNCDVLFTLLAQDGGSSNVRVTVTNDGTVDASSLTLHWANGTSPCVTVDEPTEQFHGSGDLCGVLRLQVQEYPSAATQSGNDRGFDTVTGESSACWFGGGAGTDTCGFNNNQDMAAFSAYTGVAGDSIDMGPIAAGDTRYYRVYINVAAGQLTNAMQGRMVEFGFTWTAEQ